MKRGRLPLTALRSFEAAGRLRSFTAAAEELFVSQAAISRQIRDLEMQLGRPLFQRVHRGVVLTEEGARLLAALTSAFDEIDSALTDIGSAEKVWQVTISSEPSFAALWLVPQLREFRTLHPNVDVTIESDPRMVEFRAREAEIAIRHSDAREDWPRTQSIRLTQTNMIPVAAPDLVKGNALIGGPTALLNQTLLHEENRKVWARWFQLAGLVPPEQDRGPLLADGALVLQAVLRGHGIGLADPIFVKDDIEAGRIVTLFDLNFPCGAYYLVARDFSRLTPRAHRFVDWITGSFADLDVAP